MRVSIPLSMSASKRFPNVRNIRDTDMEIEEGRYYALKTKDGDTILDWNGREAQDAVKRGFIDPRDWHESAYEYAKQLGVI